MRRIDVGWVDVSSQGAGGIIEGAVLGAHATVVRSKAPLTRNRPQTTPVWRIVLPVDGNVTVGPSQSGTVQRDSGGVVCPPEFNHRLHAPGGTVSIHLHAWHLALGPGTGDALPLDGGLSRELIRRWVRVSVDDVDAAVVSTVGDLRGPGLLPPQTPQDPRVTRALEALPASESITELAREVGLSTSRFRMLFTQHTGTTPQRLRAWLRLRRAMEVLPNRPIALAATHAGFSDQSHMTRTARELVGLTPAGLAKLLVR